jgi:hypothetical protein
LKPTTYTSEEVLEEFYKAIADEDSGRLRRVHIPRSDVFYVREAIFNDTGVRYTLDRVERAMYLEGFLRKEDVFEPENRRDWE